MQKDVVRFYISRSYDTGRSTLYRAAAAAWLPIENADRCLSFNAYESATHALQWTILSAFTAGPIWSYLGTFGKHFYKDRTFARPDLLDRVPKVPPAYCVCVAVAFYLDPDVMQAEYRTPRQSPRLIRDIRLFTGTDGCSPQGPRFGDLAKQKDDSLLADDVLRLMALTTIG